MMDKRHRAGLARRLLVLVVGMLLAGMVGSAPAYAQDLTSTDLTSTTTDSSSTTTDSSSTTTDSSSTTTDSSSTTTDLTSTDLTADLTSTDLTSTDLTADLTSTDLTADLTSTTSSSTSTSSTGSTSGIETIYAPPQYYGGDGHRYYGRYHDNGCGCDRYASANYTPQTVVVATQVASVPKGGVNTGDGSFQ